MRRSRQSISGRLGLTGREEKRFVVGVKEDRKLVSVREEEAEDQRTGWRQLIGCSQPRREEPRGEEVNI